MKFTQQIRKPPRLYRTDGMERRIGVELEFAALSARQGAILVQSLFGGSIEEEDPHRFHVAGTEFGAFTSELDTQFAHRSYGESAQSAASAGEDLLGELMGGFRDEMRRIYGDISSLVVPCEIICPPIPLTRVTVLEALVSALNEAGAEGTRTSPFYAFGAQLNPEIATDDPDWLTAILKAYLLVSDWLRAVMEIDATRRLVAFADPFPAAYVHKVVDPGYWPGIDSLIADYIAANPTRNRELDLLPLMAWLAPDVVSRNVPDPRIKSRPAFHYRLPDANLGVPDWSLTLEWNRWCVVEQLAQNRATLDDMGRAYQVNRARILRQNWALKASEWLVLS